MSRQIRQYMFVILLLGDFLAITIAWISAYYLRFKGGFSVPLGIPKLLPYMKLIPFIFLSWTLALAATGQLGRMTLRRRAGQALLEILPSSVACILGFISFTYFYDEYRYSRGVLLGFALLLGPSIILGRVIARACGQYILRRGEPRQIVLVARGSAIEMMVSMSEKMGWEIKHVLGVILPGDDDTATDREFCQKYGLPILQQDQDWVSFFLKYPAQSLVIALPMQHNAFIENNLAKIADQISDIQIVPSFTQYTKLSLGAQVIDGIPVVSLHESPLSGYNLFLKRLFDILGSGVAIILLSPAMAVIAILVKLSSPGPVFYRQERMSLDGTRFQCLKFRSMPCNAEETTGAVWAKPGDQRATPIGSFLRRTSLDELPQFFNVLKGEMSLVGPQPERPIFVDKFRQEVPGYMLRHKVKTGITGWAQVNGWRGSTSIERRIECDLFYIQNWSLWLDVKILFMTLDEVVRGRNAY